MFSTFIFHCVFCCFFQKQCLQQKSDPSSLFPIFSIPTFPTQCGPPPLNAIFGWLPISFSFFNFNFSNKMWPITFSICFQDQPFEQIWPTVFQKHKWSRKISIMLTILTRDFEKMILRQQCKRKWKWQIGKWEHVLWLRPMGWNYRFSMAPFPRRGEA